MKQYFANCTTLDEAKVLYKKLAFQLHPDISGRDTTAEFQEMQNQFERFRPQKEKFTGEYQKHTDENRAKRFMDIINDLLKIEGIVIEICGSFIWISGDTKPVKDQIKAIRNEAFKNAQWHTKKEMWYFAPIWYHKVSAGLSMDAIRNYYGSETFEAKREEKEEFKRIRA